MSLPLCSLCLFKIELVEDEVELCENTQRLKEILYDLFSDRLKLTDTNLQYVCRNCCDKLESFHEYYLFVLKNQTVKVEQQNKLLVESSGSEFVNVIKVEPDIEIEKKEDCSDDDVNEDNCDPDESEDLSVKPDREKDKKKTGRPKLIGPRNRDTRRMRHVRKTTPEQQAHKDMVYQTITDFYDMTCDLCPNLQSFSSYSLVIRHCRTDHKRLRVWICCNLRLYTTSKLYEHAMRHKNPNMCELCGDQFVENKAFKAHKCPKAKYVVCNECEKQFQHKSMLRDHLKIHFPEYIFCELCGKSFTKKHKFREHMNYDHGNLPPEELFKPCPICGKLISTRNYGMKDHIRERHEKQSTGPSKCIQCNKEYANEKNLKRHIREEHTFGRKHECKLCNKRFLNPKTLKEHESIHTGHPNYVCEYCDAPFKSNGNYYSHKRRLHPVEYAAQKASRKLNMIKKREIDVN